MNIIEITALLAAANLVDPRVEVTDQTARRWQSLIGDLELADAQRALDQHYRATSDRIMPADIRKLVNGAPDAGRLARQQREELTPVRGIPKPRWFDSAVREAAAAARDRGRTCSCVGESHRVSR